MNSGLRRLRFDSESDTDPDADLMFALPVAVRGRTGMVDDWITD
jgi:hypothetical protein